MKILNLLTKAIMALTLSAVGAFSATVWDGTVDTTWYSGEAQAYNLTTAEQLAGLAKLVNGGTSSFEGKTIALGADIFLNDTAGAAGGTWASVPRTAWTPIGTSAHPFKGEFDGLAGANKKRKIYGLYFNDSTASYVGLFGYTDGVKISNLDMLVGRVIAKNDVGALVGRSVAGTVTNVHAEVKVKGTNHVGGLVGYTTGSLTRVSVTENVAGQDSVGGVAGYVGGNVTGTAKSNCYFVGEVTGKNYVGGVAGYVGGSVSHSYSEGSVTAEGTYVGGVAGYANSTIDSAHHVNGDVSGVDHVGGVVGIVGGSVLNSYSEGSVTATGSCVGGLAGYVGGSVSNSYSEGSVTASINYVGGLAGFVGGNADSVYHVNGDVSGTGYVGGLFGELRGNIKNSHSEASVTGKGQYVGGAVGLLAGCLDSVYHVKGDISGTGYVGGLIGQAAGGICHIADAYSEGDVKGSAAFVGGLIGETYVNYTIVRSHAKGNVTSTSSYVGGVVGQVYYTVDSTVYHIDGNVTGVDHVGGVVGQALNTVNSAYHEGGDVIGLSYVGGLVGEGTYINDSYADSYVKGTGDYVGGLAGYLSNDVESSYYLGDVEGNSYVGGLIGKGNFINDSYADSYIKGTGDYVGGLAGYLNNDINRSYHLGNVEGNGYVGGLAGSAIIIANSYAEGDVTGKSNNVGGLVGKQSNSSYYIKLSHAVGSVTGADYVGGVAGASYGAIESVYHEGGSVSGTSYVGGVAGDASSTIKKSYAKGPVSGTSFRVGGLAGNVSGVVDSSYHVEGSVTGVTYDVGGLIGRANASVTNSYAEGDVIGEGSAIGGVVGFAYSGTIDNSYHIGNVSATSFGAGGVVGYTQGNIANVYHKGGTVSGLDSVGGVAGKVEGTVRGVYAEGIVSGRNTVGGVAGYAASTIDDSRSLADSVSGIFQVGGLAGYAKGVVDSSYAVSNVKGDDNVGGLIGSSYGDVSNSYALGNVVGDVEHSSAGNDNIGGLVGYAYSGSIAKSMALGNIRGTTKVGGLVGRFEGNKISQSYAGGSVTGLYDGDPADEIGNYYIGGLVGYGKGTLAEVYASGVVKGMEVNPFMTGCLVGSVSSEMTISKAYYDATICKLGVEGTDPETKETFAVVSGSPSQNTVAMQTQSTFEEWDFEDTWKIMESSYPFLQVYSNSLTNAVVETASLKGFVYDGSAKTPIVKSVALFGEVLTWETEYTVAYESNVNAGTALIKICGITPYGGCKVVPFEIAPLAVKPTIAAIASAVYTGKEIKPSLIVVNGEDTLKASEYDVEYKNNVNVGTATATITMKGNYSGTASKTFAIAKATPVIATKPTASDISLGSKLSKSILDGGSANVEGSFEWVTPDSIPAIDNEGFEVVFVPTDTANYKKPETFVISVTVIDKAHVVVNIGAESVLDTFLDKGSKFALPAAPDSVGYDFVGWYNGKTLAGASGDSLVASADLTIEAVYSAKKFTIAFVDYDESELQSDDVAFGTTPELAGKTPSRVATAQYTYTFKGWDPEIVAVTESATYKAVYDSVVNKYVVTFLGVDEEELQADSLEYGAVPTYAGADPTRSATAQYTYTFAGWSPAIAEVTETATYVAAFDSIVNKYLVTFNDEDGSVLQSDSVAYGEVPEYAGDTPTKDSTAERNYTFVGWTPMVAAVTGDASYTAVYDSVGVTYTIAFVDYDGTELQSGAVEFGTTPEFAGETPSRVATAQYTYTFKGWDSEIAAVTGDATYKAVYDSVVNKYVVTFFDYDGSELKSENVEYGMAATAPAEPEREGYKFSGWDEEFDNVVADLDVTAQYEKLSSSSSELASSSSVKPGSSSSEKPASSSSSSESFVTSFVGEVVPQFRAEMVGRSVQISGARVGSHYAIMDMQGRIMKTGIVNRANFSVALPRSGSYMFRIGGHAQRVNVK